MVSVNTIESEIIDDEMVSNCIEQLRKLDGDELEIQFGRAAVIDEFVSQCKDDRRATKAIAQSGLMTARHAYNLREVHRRFAPERARWAAVKATVTTLILLARADDEIVESVYTDLADGKRVTTNSVRKLVAAAAEPTEAARFDVGGQRALERRAMEMAKGAVAELLARLDRIDGAIRSGITWKADGRPRVVKKVIVDATKDDARVARRLFETSLVRFVPHTYFDGARNFSLATAPGDDLLALRYIIEALGRAEDWGAGDSAVWLTEIVLPVLAWSLGRESAPDNVIDQIGEMVRRDAVRWSEWRSDLAEEELSEEVAAENGDEALDEDIEQVGEVEADAAAPVVAEAQSPSRQGGGAGVDLWQAYSDRLTRQADRAFAGFAGVRAHRRSTVPTADDVEAPAPSAM